MNTGVLERGGERVLVVDDDPLTLQCLADTVEMMDLAVSRADNGETAMQVFDQDRPEVVVTDVRLPYRDGLALTTYIKSRQSDCPVIIITGYGDEQTAVAALKAGATDYLPKPFQLPDLQAAIRRALGDVEGRRNEQWALQGLDHHHVRFVMNNAPDMIGDLVSYLLRPIEGLLPSTERFHIRIALQELLMNAVEHGNLGISHEDKMEALDAQVYRQLVEERCRHPIYGGRRVHVELTHDLMRREIQCRICDEGEGFHWQAVMNQGQEHKGVRLGSGRGIFLAKQLMPSLRYHGCGNEVSFLLRYGEEEVRREK